MSQTTYLDLPEEALFELWTVSVRNMIDASESDKEDAIAAFRSAKKQASLIMDTIDERRGMKLNNLPSS